MPARRLPENIYGDSIAGSLAPFAWRQFISRSGWTSDISLTEQGILIAEVIQINYEDLGAAMRVICGASYAEGERLRRETPMRHPQFSWARANKIVKVEGIKPIGPATYGTNGDLTNYQLAHLTVQFATLPYRVLANGHVDEWDRYVSKLGKSTAEYINREEGSLVWCAGSNQGTGIAFAGSRTQLLTKRRLNWVWHKVPEVGWLDSNGIPANYQNALGRVNAEEFAGFAAGTLLMENADNEQPEMQYDYDGQLTKETSAPVGGVPRTFNVPLNMIFFDPPYGLNSRGHNLAPDPSNGLWYLVHSPTAYVSRSGTLTSGDSRVTGLSSTSDLHLGSAVTGTNIPNDTRIKSIDSTTQITLTNNATGSGAQTLSMFMVRYPSYDFTKIFKMNF